METFAQKRLRRFLPMISFTLALLLSLLFSTTAAASFSVTIVQKVSSDPYTNSDAQHKTQVEPDTFSYGSTVVSAFQSGRFYAGGGSSNISWATSHDGGLTWTKGNLPGITINEPAGNGTYQRTSDPVVAYDLARNTWLIASLGIITPDVEADTLISRSTDGGLTWSNPTLIGHTGGYLDKEWVTCDNYRNSPHFGRCYMEWDDGDNNGRIEMTYTDDAGLTWTTPTSPIHQTFSGLGGLPVVQPNGNVIVPIYGYDLTTYAESIYSYRSTDGGLSWDDPIQVAPVPYTNMTAKYRGGSLPSADVDKDGKVYVVWSACNFNNGCEADNIVMSTTTDGITYTPVQLVPLDPGSGGVEHLTAGIAVDNNTPSGSAHIAITYYYFDFNPHCTADACNMYVGYASSINGGASWSPHQTLAGPMHVSWLANTDEGYMTGDYLSTSIVGGHAVCVFPVAKAPKGTRYDESMYASYTSITGGSVTPSVSTNAVNVANANATNDAKVSSTGHGRNSSHTAN